MPSKDVLSKDAHNCDTTTTTPTKDALSKDASNKQQPNDKTQWSFW